MTMRGPWGARRPSGWPVLRTPKWMLAAGLVLLASGTAYRTMVAHKRLTVPREIAALAAWRPATDVLLATPGSALLRSSPNLGLSLLGAMPVLETPAGDQR